MKRLWFVMITLALLMMMTGCVQRGNVGTHKVLLSLSQWVGDCGKWIIYHPMTGTPRTLGGANVVFGKEGLDTLIIKEKRGVAEVTTIVITIESPFTKGLIEEILIVPVSYGQRIILFMRTHDSWVPLSRDNQFLWNRIKLVEVYFR